MTLKEISDGLTKTRDVIAKRSTAELEADLAKILKWRDTATDRLEKMVWGDLATFIKRELKKRKNNP